MIPSRRRAFNRSFTPDRYNRFLDLLELRTGEPTQFRHSETPCFFSPVLIEKMARAGQEIVAQLLANPDYQRRSYEAIPERYRVPNEAPAPLFVSADFGLNEFLEPRLVEIQGFPSIYAYQPVVADCYREAYGLTDPTLAALPFGLALPEYQRLLGQAILGDQPPENVVLTEIDPDHQKTRHDFRITERWFGVRTVDIRALHKRGRQLYYDRDGVETPVRRIYNRAIADELERKRVELPWDWRDDLNVEWAGHPNWFFQLSKFSLPFLRHPTVPRAQFLSEAGVVERPEDLVLKPLYSFAGLGVIVGPTHERIAAVPAALRSGYILQERVNFHPVVETPFGPTKVEVRIMYLWLGELRPVNIVVRMGRGLQMGVDHNKEMQWVGGSAGLTDGSVA